MNTQLDFSQKEWDNMKRLIDDFQSYYEKDDEEDEEDEDSWSFTDLDDQREIACQLIWFLADKIKNA